MIPRPNLSRRCPARAWSARGALLVALSAVIDVSLAPAAAAQSDLLISPVTVIDGTGAPPRSGMAVLISGGRIAAIRSAAELPLPPGATLVDGGGGYLIPGLWDMHVHLSKAGESALGLLVANGVTGVRDMGGDTEMVRAFRQAVEAGDRVGPRIRLAGPILESPARVERMRSRGVVEPIERYRAAVPDPGSAERVVDSIARLGVDLIKFRTVESLETYRAIAAAAARRDLPLSGHADDVPPEEIVRARQSSIEHPIVPPLRGSRSRRAEITSGLVAHGTAIVPTLVTYYAAVGRSRGELQRLVDDSIGALDPRRRYIRGFLLEHWRFQVRDRPAGVRGWLRDRLVAWYYRRVRRDLREMHAAGMRILPGTDVAVVGIYSGFSLHDELAHLVDVIGMTPMQALVSATRSSTELLGLDHELGTIEGGKAADLVLLERNPLEDIRNTRRIRAVVIEGRYLDRTALDSLLRAAESAAAG